MLFLGESHSTGDPTPYLQAEAVRIGELQQAGKIEMVLLKTDGSGAIVLLQAAETAGISSGHARITAGRALPAALFRLPESARSRAG